MFVVCIQWLQTFPYICMIQKKKKLINVQGAYFYASIISASGSALFKLSASSCKYPDATGLAVCKLPT